jgi:hypothetical protein
MLYRHRNDARMRHGLRFFNDFDSRISLSEETGGVIIS